MSTYRPQITRVESGGSAPAKIKAGRDFLGQKKFDEALAQFEAAARLEPGNVPSRILAGSALTKLRRFEEAARYLNDAIQLDPVNKQAYLRAARASVGLEDLNKAMEHVQNAIRVDPQAAVARFFSGYLHHKKSELGKAREEFGKALLLNPRMVRARMELARVLYEQGEHPESLEQLAAASRIEPENARVKEGLGKILLLTGDHAGAVAAFEQAVALGRDDSADCRIGLAEAAIGLGDFERAEASLRAAPEGPKSQVRLQKAWGDLAFGRGEFQQAVEQYRSAILLASSEGHNLDAELHAAQPTTASEWQEAASRLREQLAGMRIDLPDSGSVTDDD